MSKPEHTPGPRTIRQTPTHINEVAAWMMAQGYATGHGDSIEDLFKELKWQVQEREREACAKVVEDMDVQHPKHIAAAIRARGGNETLMRHKKIYVTLVTPSAAIRARGTQGKSQGKSQDDWRPDPDLA